MTISEVFEKYNIDCVGVTDATLYNEAENADFKSIIVALFPYFCGYEENSNLSIYTHGKDYHGVIKKILTCVAEDLHLSDFRIHSDIGPEIERRLALNAGLCFRGRNQMCINEKYGSYFFIGYIACKENFALSVPNEKSCLNCMACVRVCPGDALNSGFDEKKCLSAITQQKQELTENQENLIRENKMIFGCDVCQKVCPHNKNAEKTKIPEFSNERITGLSLEDIVGLSNREFKQKFADRAFAWRGKKVLERNIKIVNKNHST